MDNVQLSNTVNDCLTKDGYKLIEGQIGNGGYEKGDRTMRLLFGAFVKYSKVNVTVNTDTNSVDRVTVDRKTSGMSGGLIGMKQVKKEMERISSMLSAI